MAVLIDNRQKAFKVCLADLRRSAQAILSALGCPEAELSVVLVSDRRIAALNRDFLNRPGPTNVIAFPMREGPFAALTPGLLGDVVISVATAAREADKAGIGLQRRVTELLLHGVLHLAGYDHESGDVSAARRMARKHRAVLRRIGQVDDA
jgi:probable rRNA maturation factor